MSLSILASWGLVVDQTNSALLCRSCQVAVSPQHLQQHFEARGHHGPCPDSIDLKRLAAAIRELPFTPQPSSALLPLSSTSAAHPDLQSRVGHLCCCGFVAIDKGSRYRHTHPAGSSPPSYRRIKAQSWAGRGSWFEVEGPGFRFQAGTSAANMRAAAPIQAFQDALAAGSHAAGLDPLTLQPIQQVISDNNPTPSGWLRKTRWNRLLRNVDLEAAAQLRHHPERALEGVFFGRHRTIDIHTVAVNRTVQRLQAAFGTATEHLSDHALSMLRCDDLEYSRASERKSIEVSASYRSHACNLVGALVGFVVAVHLLTEAGAITAGAALDEGEQGGDNDDEYDAATADDNLTADAVALHPLGAPSKPGSSSPTKASLTPLHRVLTEVERRVASFVAHIISEDLSGEHISNLILALLRQELDGPGQRNAIMTFSAISGIDQKRGCKWVSGPKHGEFLVRLILGLKLSLWAAAEDAPGVLSAAERTDLLEMLRKEVAVYGNGLAMSALYMQRNYARGMDSTSSNMFRAVWAADFQSFTINGDLVRLEDVRRMAKGIIDEVEAGVAQLESRDHDSRDVNNGNELDVQQLTHGTREHVAIPM
ncbi:hypothetical protein OC844_007673, partial [Tilletia horrida]